MIAEGLRGAPEDFWREAELGLVGAEGVEAGGDVGEVVVALAVVAAAAAVGGVADGAMVIRGWVWVWEEGKLEKELWGLLVFGGPCCVCSYWIRVRENDVGTCGVFFVVVVFAIQAKRNRMIRVERLDLIIGSLGCIQSIYMSI